MNKIKLGNCNDFTCKYYDVMCEQNCSFEIPEKCYKEIKEKRQVSKIETLERHRDIMLEALIDLTISQYHDNYNACLENGWTSKESKQKSLLHIKDYTDIIEEVAGKQWSDIVKLLKENT